MSRAFLAVTLSAAVLTLPSSQATGLKSGPQADEILPGAFQPLNINGPFAGRQHCLVTQFRLNPVAVAFVRTQSKEIDPEVKKLLTALDQAAADKHADTGLDSFVVFLSADAKSGVTEAKVEPKAILAEAKHREDLVNGLKEFAKPFKRLVVTCAPAEAIASQYRLADAAEVTVVVYASHHVFANFAFGRDQLKQEGIDQVLKGVDDLLDRLKKRLRSGNDQRMLANRSVVTRPSPRNLAAFPPSNAAATWSQKRSQGRAQTACRQKAGTSCGWP